MKLIHALLLAAVCLSPLLTTARTTDNFDSGWRFLKADATGAEQNNFPDSAWRTLDLPHDWSIEGPFAETNLTGGAGAFLPSGVGWYRKHFSLPKTDAGKVVSVEFDGVMQNSDVWINGFHLGHRPNGYVSFSYELTGHLNFGGDNVLAVRADTSAQPASRWYSGAGIYRHVRFVVNDQFHFIENGVFISTPKVSATEATVKIETTMTNASASKRKITLVTQLIAPDGKMVASAEMGGEIITRASEKFSPQIVIANPQLWNLDNPKLYSIVSEVRDGEKILDAQTNSFGIRDAHFKAATGFWLNGKNFKLYGVCLHHDGGAFGAAVPLSIWETRLNTLRTLGVNAIRTSHNPAAPEFLDLCDRMGFLVMDEFFDCWTRGKTASDYHLFFSKWSHTDERDAILRDRNHPSVIIYSVGNEILDTPNAEKAKKILTGLVAVAHETDPTRPVTQALFRPNVSHDYDNGLADLLDVVGQNYREKEILAAHEQKPTRKIIGTENTHDRNQWLALRDNPAYAGQFLWTGVDYLGESKHWPTIGHASGLLDRTGAVKPRAFERASWWLTEPMVRIMRRTAPDDRMPTDPGYGGEELHTQVEFADWTSRNPKPHDETVEAYSNCEEVELFLNGHSLGAKTINADASPRIWKIPFTPGTLKAVAKNGGAAVATNELRTAGKATKIILSTETKTLSPGFNKVAIVRARIVDANGVAMPRANDLISFQVSGPGSIAAVDSADPASHELFQASQRRAYHGECVAYIKTSAAQGEISVTAAATGLQSGLITFQAEK